MADPVRVVLVAERWGDGEAEVRAFVAALEEAKAEANELALAMVDARADALAFAEGVGALEGYGDAVGAAADAADGLADEAKKGGGAARRFQIDMQGLATASRLTGVALGTAASSAAIFANATERGVGVFNRMQGSVDAAQAAVGGMVSRMDLAISRNRLMQSGLELTDEQFASVAEVATDYAAAVGGDAAQAMEQLGEGLVSLSAESLRRFGIEVDASSSRSQQFSAAMAQLRERAAEMETGADTAGGAVQRFRVALEDAYLQSQRAADVITRQMGPAFDDLARAITGSSEATLAWRDVTSTTEDIFVGFTAAALAGIETITVAIGRAIEGWRGFFRLIGEGWREVTSGTFDFAAALQRTREQAQSIRGTESLRDIFSNTLSRNLRTAVAEGPRGGSGALPAPTGPPRVPSAGSSSSGSTDLRSPEERIADMLAAQEGAEAAARVAAKMDRAMTAAVSSARHALGQWDAGLDARSRAFNEANEKQQEFIDRQKELARTAAETAAAFHDSWRRGVDGVVEALNEANEAARAAGAAQVSAMEAAGMAVKAVAAQMGNSLLGGVANAFAGAAKAALKGEQSFGEALAGMLEDTLWSIGTQATVLAVFEFAKAVGDAASMNYAGAAAHAAAGVAYTAVAALAFGGAAGLAAGSAGASSAAGTGEASSPASPQPSNDNGGGGGGDTYNITFGGPMVTAATYAELGREFRRGLESEQRRWGRAA